MSDSAIPLAADFAAASQADWLSLVDKTLKGAPLERLRSRTYDGGAVEPLYFAAESAAPMPAAIRPRGRKPTDERAWDIRTVVAHSNPQTANAQLLHDLENGAASILLRLDPTGDGVAGFSGDLAPVTAGMELALAPLALDAGWNGPAAADGLAAAARSAPRAQLAFHLDPLSAFARDGASPGPLAAHLTRAAVTAARHADTYPRATLFLASGGVVHEAGGSDALELGFATACALAYARALVQAGLPVAQAFSAITLGLHADAEVFATVAKLRAARTIWARLTTACGTAAPAVIEARSSRRMLSTLDPWVNLLRLTAAGFGAALGGADAIVLDPFTQPLGPPTDFARRQARNAQIVLMEEGQVGRVADPAGGAWFVETRTDQLARAGWAAFQAIERQGGVAAALKGGHVAEAAAATRTLRQADIAHRRVDLIGVSAFPMPTESGVEVAPPEPTSVSGSAPSAGLDGADDACPALTAWRAAEPFERLRQQAYAMAARPKVYLASLGPPADHAARVDFARALFAAAGVVAYVGEPADYGRDIASTVVICGPDTLYPEQAAITAQRLRAAGATRVYLAGKPGGLESGLRDAGVSGFIHAGFDSIAFLQAALSEMTP